MFFPSRYLECKIPSKAKLKQEIDELEAALSNCDSPLVFSHNDLLLANAIVDRKTEKVTFIDYEYGDYNYQAFDIGNHFNEFPGKIGHQLQGEDWQQYKLKISAIASYNYIKTSLKICSLF